MSPGKSLKDQLINRVLGRGAIYHAYSDVAGKGKWIVVLNDRWPPDDGLVVYAFFTTKVDRFRRTRIPPTAYLEVEVGGYDFCKEPTILDLTDVRKRPFSEVSNAAMFKYSGTLRDDHLARVDEIVMHSPYVPKVHKRAILGDRFKG